MRRFVLSLPVCALAPALLIALLALLGSAGGVASGAAAAAEADSRSVDCSGWTMPPAATIASDPADATRAALFWVRRAADGTGRLTRALLNFASGSTTGTLAPQWEATTLLDQMDFRQRRIRSANGETGAQLSNAAFSWSGLTADQRSGFARSAAGSDDALGPARVDYVRGDRSGEIGRPGGVFRARSSVMGSIGHSVPLYVGAPPAGQGDAAYRAFFDSVRTRAATVYVGANDGMLHAFRAADGVELFTYVPAVLMAKVPLLPRTDVLLPPYVDGELAAAEARIGGRWRTVLAGGMGRGAGGVYALDVSDPEHFEDGAGALFEFTPDDDADVGYQFGAPEVARLRDADGILRDYLVMAGGYRHQAQSDARSALFVLSLERKPGEPWKQGSNYFKFVLPRTVAPPASFDALDAGLSAPALVPGDDGAVRHAYAGDLQGNLWRFDFSGRAPWRKAAPAAPLFVASDANGARQPIAQRPKVAFAATSDTDTVDEGAYLILFGTGKLLEAGDGARAGFATQSFYAVRDALAPASTLTRRALQERALTAQDDGFTVQIAPAEEGAHGWYVDLVGAEGERVSGAPLLAGGSVVFNTLRFDARCVLLGRSYGLPVLSEAAAAQHGVTGLRTAAAASPLLWHAGPLDGDPLPGRPPAQPVVALLDLGVGDARRIAVAPALVLPGGRLSWREIANWQERRAQALHE